MTKKKNKDVKNKVVDAELVTTEPEVKTMQPVTPMDLLIQGKEGGATIEQMERLFDLQLRFDDNEARKAYFKAVAAFKAVSIEIIKDKHVHFDTNKGPTDYDHATLGSIIEAITAEMSKFGLSHSWSMAQDGDKIKVTCRLAHELGYSEDVFMEGPPDTSGGKNAIQAIASTNTYLQRYTVLAITGLASKELTPDDDGHNACPEDVPYDVISDEQWAKLDTMISQSGDTMERFCKYYKVKDLCFLPAEKFDTAVKLMDKKMKDNADG